jgi:ribonuclease P protein component
VAKEFSYNKQEKLKSRKLLEQVFATGRSFSIAPIKVLYLRPGEPLDFAIKAGMGVGTRYFKKATDRNRVKRLLREAYRLNKAPLHQWSGRHNAQLAVFFLYTAKTLPGQQLIADSMNNAIQRLAELLEKSMLNDKG